MANRTEAEHALALDQMNRARRRLMGTENCEDGKTSIAECTESYCQITGRCSLSMQDYTNRKEGKL